MAEVATDVTEVEETAERNWAPSAPAVRKALAYVKRNGGTVTAEQLVSWDANHGRKLFNWSDQSAAEQWRLHQARLFLNSFRGVVDGFRVRAFINMPAGEETGTEEREYVSTDNISRNTKMRAWVISDITRRMKSLASELRMWKLESDEREAILAQLKSAME